MLDLINEIWQTLRNNRLRTMLTGISVAWGVFMLVVLLGASRGVRNQFVDSWAEQGNNEVNFWGGNTSKPYLGFKEGRRIRFESSDLDALKNDNVDFVASVMGEAWVDTAKISNSKDVLDRGFCATFPEGEKEHNIDIVFGRFINQRDIDDARRVMVIADKNAERLFGADSLALGKTVSCMGLAWTIAGVYRSKWNSDNYVPYTTYKAITGNDNKVHRITVFVDGLETEQQAEEAEQALRATLGRQHQFDPTDRSAVWSWNAFASYLDGMKVTGYLNLAVWVIGIFTLLTGIVGVSNIMFVSVRERTHEIGIRRAIGAKPRSILTQILAESVAITALFGYMGIVMGTIALQIVNKLFGHIEAFSNATVDLNIAFQVTLALVVAGGIAGLFPAMKAIKVKPVEALRDE